MSNVSASLWLSPEPMKLLRNSQPWRGKRELDKVSWGQHFAQRQMWHFDCLSETVQEGFARCFSAPSTSSCRRWTAFKRHPKRPSIVSWLLGRDRRRRKIRNLQLQVQKRAVWASGSKLWKLPYGLNQPRWRSPSFWKFLSSRALEPLQCL